jgi:hypothetical protein
MFVSRLSAPVDAAVAAVFGLVFPGVDVRENSFCIFGGET